MGRDDLITRPDGRRLGVGRCADAARREDVDPIGTSGSYDGFLLVEWPLPWPRDAAEVHELAPLVDVIGREAEAGRRWRIQLVAGVTPRRPGDLHTLVVYRRRTDGLSGFSGRTFVVPLGDLVPTACRSVVDVAAGGARAGDEPVDVLICTHGTRDACCGSRGTALFRAVEPTELATPCRIWRTSHLGGHRFAPTALVLPDGSSWAYLDAGRLADVVDRRVPPARLHRTYRGNAALEHRVAQAAERQALVAEGWAWWGYRTTIAVGPTGAVGGTEVDVSFVRPDGSEGRLRYLVSEGPPCELPPCRGGGSGTTDRPLVVTAVR